MIAVDWGTSSCRAYRVDRDGRVVERRESAMGVARIRDDAFAEQLERQVGDWLASDAEPVMMSGMIGSRNGWVEVPYVPCPAGPEEIAAGLWAVTFAGRRGWIAPGLSCRDSNGVPDVMRGEETQILGAMDDLPPDATVCLPGTHSKWVDIRAGRIAGFSTAMTGELFATLRDHSILRHTIAPGPTEANWFAEGLARSRATGGLLHHLFGVRSRMLFGELPATGIASYLSGILIGHEIAAVAAARLPVYLIGAAELTTLYRQAIESRGRSAVVLDPDVAAGGLLRLAARIAG